MYEFETERLRLRPPLRQDMLAMCEYLQDVEIHRNTLLIPHPYHLEHAESLSYDGLMRRLHADAIITLRCAQNLTKASWG
jgi:RimJ/RimL family protein N-acetyltransferase